MEKDIVPGQRAPCRSVVEVQVRYAETDQMGVVHHSVYPVYFEIGRTDLFSRYILPYSAIEKMGIWAPVINFSCAVKSRASYEDVLQVVTTPCSFTRTTIRICYEIRQKATGTLVATGDSVHAFISPERKILRIRNYPDLYGRLERVFSAAGEYTGALHKRNNPRE